MLEIFSQIPSVETIILWGGPVILFCIIFAESGLFFGFFLPGDSLLFTAGVLAAAGFLNIYALIPVLIIAAVLGDQAGYFTGKHFGRRFFKKKDSAFFKHEHLMEAEKFYEEHGQKTIVLARFVPIIRTFAPIVAGIATMRYRSFVTYNVLGGVLWVVSLVGGGYLLVQTIPGVERYLHLIILIIILVSFIPVIIEYSHTRKRRSQKQ